MTDRLLINGMNGRTGQYGPMPSFAELVTLARNEVWNAPHLSKLRELDKQTRLGGALAPRDKVLVTDLSQTGWGVIFAQDIDIAVRQALAPLLAHRRSIAAKYDEALYRELVYSNAQTTSAFLHDLGAHEAGPVDPEQLPYYLLLVGDPVQIPYRFQYELDVEYAVGRIYFASPEEYAHYARTVIDMEKGQPIKQPRAVFFAPHHKLTNELDFTDYSANQLVPPLVKKIQQQYGQWTVSSMIAEEATKANLSQLLGGTQTPNLLFTATHGVEFPDGDLWQLERQGALVCQDINYADQFTEEHYFSADDVGDAARLAGLISFHVACYSAGSPGNDDFPRLQPLQHDLSFQYVNHQPFLAALPRRLLGHSGSGALAVIGHIERLWTTSFMSTNHMRAEHIVFEDTLARLMDGYPVGYAMELFNRRYAQQATLLSNKQEELKRGLQPDDLELVTLWTACMDARNYIIVGDPAARLYVEETNA